MSSRSSGPSDNLAPPPSPYPAHVDPSPVDSNGTESTEIEDEKQDGVKSPLPEQSEEVQSPDIEITSPQSIGSVRVQSYGFQRHCANWYRIACPRSTRACHRNEQILLKMRRSLSYMHQRATATSSRRGRLRHPRLIVQRTPSSLQARPKRLEGTRLRYGQADLGLEATV